MKLNLVNVQNEQVLMKYLYISLFLCSNGKFKVHGSCLN